NLLVALSILALYRRSPAPPVSEGSNRSKNNEPFRPKVSIPVLPKKVIWSVLLGISLSGFISMIYEVAWSRTLSLLVDSSVYGFSIMLTTFLVGIALGSYFFSNKVDTLNYQGFIWAWLQIGIGIFAFLSLVFFQELPYWYLMLYRSLGKSINLLLTGKFLLAFFIMLAPTLFMGAIFPLTVKIYTSNLKQVGRMVGNIYTINTIGCILGSFAGGFFLIPLLGIRNTILLGIGLNLLLGFYLLILTAAPRPPLKWIAAPAVFLLTLIILLFPPAWKAPLMVSGVYIYAHSFKNISHQQLMKMYEPENEPLLFYKEGHTCTISVHKSRRTGTVYMKSNGKVEASTKGDMPTQVLVAHLPMLLAPHLDEVLVVGMGSGVTVGSVTPFPAKKITLVELEEAVIQGSHFFDQVNNQPLKDPRLTLRVADARNYLLVTSDQYDVIISEPSNPWMAGVANVFTQEFFRLGYHKLKPAGVFCQWLQLYKISPESFKTVLTTFHSVFPYIYVFQPQEKDLVMVGFKQRPDLSLARIKERMDWRLVQQDLKRIGVVDLENLMSRFTMGPAEVAAVTRSGILNTDDNALIEFSTPKTLFVETEDLNAQILEPYKQPAKKYFY
ncbi:MAG: fused MFS/spermidine synthase, partial [Thermodesulfobacteriota bacterium]